MCIFGRPCFLVPAWPYIFSSSSRMATLPTCHSWSTTRDLVLPNPPVPAWSSARAALGGAPREENFSANATTSFALSPLSSPVGRGQLLPTSQDGLSARWASARWSGSGGSARQPRGVWASLQGAGAAVGAPGRGVEGYLALNRVRNGAAMFKHPAWTTVISGRDKNRSRRRSLGGGFRNERDESFIAWA